jgi:outer membrane protein assembly factor BamB
VKPADGPLLYEVRCMNLDSGRPHRRLLAVVTRSDGRLSWHFQPGAWVSSADGADPHVYLRCPRHGIGAVTALDAGPAAAVRSKPRVVAVACS